MIDLQSAIPKLTDFGLAKFTGEATQHTHTGTVLGTPAYMAPEQADGRLAEVAAQSDVYALGVVLYELLAGRPPFQGANDVDTLQQVLTEEPLPPRRLRPGLPRDLETICLKCLAKETKRRYAGAALLAADLRSFLAGEPILARRAGGWERAAKWARRRPAVAALSSVAAAAFLALAVFVIWYEVKLREHTTGLQNALNRAEAGERRLREENYAIQMKLADTMQGHDPSGLLSDLLTGLRPGTEQEDLRGFEWHYLWNVARRDLQLRGHLAGVSVTAISPDGKFCASGDGDGALRLWDMRTNSSLGEWIGHAVGVKRLAFSPDGSRLISVGIHKAVTEWVVWDVMTRKEIARLERDCKHQIRDAAITPDGVLLAFIESERSHDLQMLGLWNWRTGQVKFLTRERPVIYSRLQFAPDGCTLAAATSNPFTLACWDLDSGEEHPLGPSHQDSIRDLAFSPDGKVLVSGSDDRTFKLWDLCRFQLQATRECTDQVEHVAFSPDGKILAVDTRGGPPESTALTLWNWPGLDRRTEVLKPGFYLTRISFSPDSQTIAVGCTDHHVRLWRPFAEKAVSTLAVQGKKEAWSVAFSPDSQTLAVGYDDEAGSDAETLKLWDVRTTQELTNLSGHQAMVSSVTFAPDGRTLISASYDNQIKTWDVRSQKVLTSWRGHTAPVKYVACSPDGQSLASAGYDNLVKVWDRATGQERFSLQGHPGNVHTVTFAPNGKELASASNGGDLRIWDLATGQARREMKDAVHILALAYSPSGQVLASANKDGVVQLHDRTGESEPRSLIGHQGEARAVAFSADGKTLASGGEDRTVRLWQVATGRELLIFKDLPEKVNCLAFSPDGRHLAAALHDGSVRLWHAVGQEE